MPKISSEKFWDLYKDLPKELQDALFALETGDKIYDICEKNEVLDNLSDVVEYVGQVLLGILPPEEFQKTLEKEAKLNPDIAKKVAREINRYVFFPLKSSLEALYKIEIAPPAKPPALETPEIPRETPAEEEPKGPDIYRESIE